MAQRAAHTHARALFLVTLQLEAPGLLLQVVDGLGAARLRLVGQMQAALLEALQAELPDLAEHVAARGPRCEAALDALGKKASAARERVHANRLAARRRAADEFVEQQAAARGGSRTEAASGDE